MSRLRKIMMVIPSLGGGGAEKHVLDLCEYLRTASIECSVLTTSCEPGVFSPLFEKAGIEVKRLPIRSMRAFLSRHNLERLRKIVEDCSPDIIHGHLYHGEFISWLASMFSDAPLIATRHSFGREFNGIRSLIARSYKGRFSRFIAVSTEVAVEARRLGAPREKIRVIPNAVDVEHFRPVEGGACSRAREHLFLKYFPGRLCQNGLLTGTLGGLKKIKNHALFIRAAASALESWPDDAPRPAFIIFGEGHLRKRLEALVSELGMENYIAMPGWFSDPAPVLPLLDIYMHTATTEGLPLALLEAMSCGLPCITSRVGGIEDAIGEDGILLDSGDLEGFTEALLRLAGDRDLRSRLGSAARERAVKVFGLEGWGKRTLEVYREITG